MDLKSKRWTRLADQCGRTVGQAPVFSNVKRRVSGVDPQAYTVYEDTTVSLYLWHGLTIPFNGKLTTWDLFAQAKGEIYLQVRRQNVLMDSYGVQLCFWSKKRSRRIFDEMFMIYT